jgi:predicted HD superfamily hydrolase involved in NAD metabolism
MLTIDEVKDKLKEYETERRIVHSIGVMNTALELYEKWGGNRTVLTYAALLHDVARDIPIQNLVEIAIENGYNIDPIEKENPILLHAPVGAIIAKKDFGVKDENILNCIKFHTTGRPGISLNEAIIYVSDFIEPGRNFDDARKVREIAFVDLTEAVLEETTLNVTYLMNSRKPIHTRTIEMFNSLLKKQLTKSEIKI